MKEDGAIRRDAHAARAQAAHFRPADVAAAEGEEQSVEQLGPAERGDESEIHPAVINEGAGSDQDSAAVAGSVGDGDEMSGEFERGAVGEKANAHGTGSAVGGNGGGDVTGDAGKAAEACVGEESGFRVEARAAGSGVEAGAAAGSGKAEEIDAARACAEKGMSGFERIERNAECASEVVAAARGQDSEGERERSIDGFVHGAVAAENDDAGEAVRESGGSAQAHGFR